MKKRNGQIDFWRFVGSIMVVMVHYFKIINEYMFPMTYALWVEFFFIVSGYFLAASVYKTKTPCRGDTLGSETVSYTLKKVGSFYPLLIFFAITAVIARMYLMGPANAIFYNKNLLTVTDFTLLYATGMPSNYFFVGQWYLSAMTLSVFIIYPLARRYTNVFENIIAPILAVFIYGILFHNDKDIVTQAAWYGFVMKGFLRGIAGVSLGVVAHRLVLNIKNAVLADSKLYKVIVTVIDICAIPLATLLIIKNIKSQYTIAIIFLMFVGIVTSLSGKSYITRFFPSKLCGYLGKLSLAIYMAHGTVIHAMNGLIKRSAEFKAYIESPLGKNVCLFLLIGGTLLLSVIALPITDFAKKLITNRLAKAKEKALALKEQQ